MITAWQRLDHLLESDLDVHVKMDVATVCGWACEITVVTTNPDDRAARSHVVLACHGTAESAVDRAMDEIDRWLEEDPVDFRHPWADDDGCPRYAPPQHG